MKNLFSAIGIAMLCAGLSACAGWSRTERDTAIGGVTGAAVGNAVTGGSTLGTIGGAAVGGAIGHDIGQARSAIDAIAGASAEGEHSMNWHRIEGNWKQFKGKAKEHWGKLTDDELDVIAGKRDQLSGKIQEQYGITKEEAEKQIAAFEKRLKDQAS